MQARVRLMSFSVIVAAAAMAVAWAMVAPSSAPARDAEVLLETRPLFLTERFSQSGPERGPIGGVVPEQLVAMRGEREGLQIAINNTSGGTLTLAGRVAGDAALQGAQSTGQITFETLRVGFVTLPQPSKGMGTSAGEYPDPLPPFVNESAAGRLTIPAGQWGGVVVIAKVRTDATPGVYGGSVEMYTGTNANDEMVYARQPFTLEVRGTTLLQPGAPKSFKTVLNVEGEAYWLQDSAMRNGPSKFPSYADRMAQLGGLMSFLDSRHITPLEMPLANPGPTGAYNCAYASPRLAAQRYLDQLKSRYLNRPRDIDPGAQQFPTRMMPTHTVGCNPDSASGGFEGTIDSLRTPGVKQDDTFNTKAPAFYRSVAGTWSTNGLWGQSNYVKHPFDEPGDASDAQRRTMSVEVPKATIALRKAVGNKAKIVIAAWPRDGRGKRLCRAYKGSQRCTNISGDTFDNRAMWDGRGADDPDIWMPHYSRLFGRTTPPILAPYKVNRERQYADRLKSIRTKRGSETWTYNFFTASKVMPQVVIDAPGTDARLQYLLFAREGISGLFISNLMMGWGSTNQMQPGTNARRKGNPYEQALYFKHPLYGLAAGWGTFIYPGYVPSLGLDGEARRNSEGATPVTSLRMESLRDGTEDGNLVQMYRERFGDAKLQQVLAPIFPGTMVGLPSTLGQVVGPQYDDGNLLAQRMETARRTMISELG